MVQEISYEELQQLWEEDQNKAGVGFRLCQKEIKEWKNNGNFKHFKNELINIPHIKFACTKEEDGSCRYYFFSHSDEMSDRILNLFYKLKAGERAHIANVANKADDVRLDDSVFGTPKLCNLF